MTRRIASFLLLLSAECAGLWAEGGLVRSSGQAIPGATITATQGSQKLVTTTGPDGRYEFKAPLPPGVWKIQVAMFGFEPMKRDVSFSPAAKADFELKLLVSPMAQRLAQMANGQQPSADPNAAAPPPEPAPAGPQSSNESFLVSGSLSQGLAPARADNGPGQGGPDFGRGGGAGDASTSQGGAPPGFGGGGGGRGGGGFGGGGGGFQVRPGGGPPGGGREQFGNRRGPNSIRGMVSYTLNNSAVNAKPFSITGQDVFQPSYAQSRLSVL